MAGPATAPKTADSADIPRPKRHYTAPDWVDVEGHPVAYRRKAPLSGAAETVLFLHGGGFTRMWLPVYEALAQKVDLIAPEHPGFGETPAAGWMKSFLDLALHYDAFLDGLGIGQVHLVGYSAGGWAAAEFATLFAKRLKSLTLVAPIGLRTGRPATIDMFQLSPPDLVDRLFNDKSVIAGFVPSEDDFDEGVQLYSEMSALATLVWSPRYNLALGRRLKRVRCPALIVKAENDRLIDPAIADLYAALLPDARTVTVAETGHALCLERPQETAGPILGFIEGIGQ